MIFKSPQPPFAKGGEGGLVILRLVEICFPCGAWDSVLQLTPQNMLLSLLGYSLIPVLSQRGRVSRSL
jgi:hypothetical protein